MSWPCSSVGRSAESPFDSRLASRGDLPQQHVQQAYQHPHLVHGYQQNVSKMHYQDGLRLAPLRHAQLSMPDGRGIVGQQALPYRSQAAHRTRIDVSDLLSAPASAHFEVDRSPTASFRSDVGQWPPHLRSAQAFTSINQPPPYDTPPVVTTIKQHQPGGTVDFTQWMKPAPDPRPSSRTSSNGAGPSRSRCDRSVSSAQTPASSHDRSFDALSALLSPASLPAEPQLPPQAEGFDYSLAFRQQPLAARACGLGDRDRRTIDPPPIIELKVTDSASGLPMQNYGYIYVLHCGLCDANGAPIANMPHSTTEDSRLVTAMMGNLVASAFTGKDERGIPGTFFVLPDLSCRYPGRYRLHFSLILFDPTNRCNIQTAVSITSEPFTAYAAKDFPGMRESTPLLKQLRRQGLSVGIKKGSEARKLKTQMRRTNGMLDGSEHDVDAEAGTQATRAMARDTPVSDPGHNEPWMTHGRKRKRVA